MFTNLVVGGACFSTGAVSWVTQVTDELGIKNCVNLSEGGAGNQYISRSTIDYLDHAGLDTQSTLVLVMWNSPGRRDVTVSKEYFDRLVYGPKKNLNIGEIGHWVFSGGLTHSWLNRDETKKIWEHHYTNTMDPVNHCKDTLDCIDNLYNYLTVHGYQFRFMTYVNCWQEDRPDTVGPDYSIAHYSGHLPSFKKIDFSKWIFINNQQDGLFEYAKQHRELMADKFHPTELIQQQFATDFVVPNLKGLL